MEWFWENLINQLFLSQNSGKNFQNLCWQEFIDVFSKILQTPQACLRGFYVAL
jgi:hypothetical protein